MGDELKGDEGELQGNSEFLPFQKADNDDAPFPGADDNVEVVALDAEPTVEEAQPTIAETLTATARAAYATASSLVDTVANDTPPPPVDPRCTPARVEELEQARRAADRAVRSPQGLVCGKSQSENGKSSKREHRTTTIEPKNKEKDTKTAPTTRRQPQEAPK